VDGTSIGLPENNVSIQQLALTPLVDSIEEFTVITNALAAEIGRTAGGAFNISTRSGTNQLHGTGFEFLRNSKLNANTWANNRNGASKTPSKNNQFGGTLGGPLVIPHLYNGRNKTFWFFSEQSDRNRNASTGTATVPIDAWRNGDFSDLKNGNGQAVIIYDPATVATQTDAAGVTYFNTTPIGRASSFPVDPRNSVRPTFCPSLRQSRTPTVRMRLRRPVAPSLSSARGHRIRTSWGFPADP
jgi:hypothetical protein